LLLTWAKTPPHFDEQEAINRVHDQGGKLILAKESHKDGNPHYHAYCEHPTRFITRKTDAFDVSGCHPNIQIIKATPWKAWDYVRKEVTGDNPLIIDEIKDRPLGRTQKSDLPGKNTEVWNKITRATSRKQVLNIMKAEQPRALVCNFNNVNNYAAYVEEKSKPRDEYTTPEDFVPLLDNFKSITLWIEHHLRRINAQAGTRVTDPGREQSGTRTASPTPSLTFCSQSDSMDGCSSVGGAELDFNLFTPPATRDSPPQEACGSPPNSQDIETAQDYELFSEYARDKSPVARAPRIITNTPQRRRKSLILWGPSQFGKTLLARSLGRHSHFSGLFNLATFDHDAEYVVFDDLDDGLKTLGKGGYKHWLGGQHAFEATDKYKKKEHIKWGKVCIVLCNQDPLREKGVDVDWLKANCIIVNVDQPICNFGLRHAESMKTSQ
jgi:hypothetical protein